MLIAANSTGERVQATRDLESGLYACPVCAYPVTLKRGRVTVPHFAHAPGSDCAASEGESPTHLLAKKVLSERFQALGYRTMIERVHQREGRRVDVAVEVPVRGGWRQVAVEVQDSRIQVETMKSRQSVDRSLGYHATAWIFTDSRAKALLPAASDDIEVRVPDEMLWLDNRYQFGVNVLDPKLEDMRRLTFDSVRREGNDWYDSDGDFQSSAGCTPRTIRTVRQEDAGFGIGFLAGRYPGDVVVSFN